MKEYKFLGCFTNESVQRAYRHPQKATILEAGVSLIIIGGVSYVAGLLTDGTVAAAKWGWKKFKGKKGGKK